MKVLNKNIISRRKILPILGGGFLLPLFGFRNISHNNIPDSFDEEYKILLRKDGTTVKVKTSTLKISKSIKNTISNTSFYNWLRNKF